MSEVVCATEGLAVGYPARRGPGSRASGRRRSPAVVLDGLDLTLRAGEVAFLLGANGSGKSTLLRTLAGMQPPLAGSVMLLGEDVRALGAAERARRLAVVLTDPVDVGLMTVTDLVALGRYPHTRWSGQLGPRDWRAVDWALRVTGSDELAGRAVAELSDGERQRTLVARALAQEPVLLALDEPVAYLDLARRVELAQILRHLARECGLAVLLTTHDLDLALREADVLWVIRRDGGLAVGGPEDLVLDGAIAAAFPTDAVRFDADRGVFTPDRAPIGRFRVAGEGPEARWAAHALEREGFAEQGPGGFADLDVRAVAGADGRPRWVLSTAGAPPTEHDTIADLARAARGAAALVTAPPGPPRQQISEGRPSVGGPWRAGG